MSNENDSAGDLCTDCGRAQVAKDLEICGGGAFYCERCYVKNGYTLPTSMPINNDRVDQMSMRILAVLATRATATIGEVLEVVARADIADERDLALYALGALTSARSIAFVDGYTRDVPLDTLRVRLVPL
jgi:hypothetical protein